MGPVGVQEMVVIFLVALLLFGPKKLPELGRTIAKAMGEFRRAQSELKATFDREMQNLEKETAGFREVAHKTTAEITSYAENVLGDSPDGTYGNSHGTAHGAVANSSNVGASETASAESHAELWNSSYTDHLQYGGSNEASLEVSQGFVPESVPEVVLEPAAHTVARGTLTQQTEQFAAPSHSVPEPNPLPELQSASGKGAHPETSPELPSLV